MWRFFLDDYRRLLQKCRMDMTPQQYRAALAVFDITQEGFADLVGGSRRSGQRWATNSVPPPVATLVRLFLARPELIEVVRGLSTHQDKDIAP